MWKRGVIIWTVMLGMDIHQSQTVGNFDTECMAIYYAFFKIKEYESLCIKACCPKEREPSMQDMDRKLDTLIGMNLTGDGNNTGG